MNRRTSVVNAAAVAKLKTETMRRRPGQKDSTGRQLSSGDVLQPKEGDIYYRTVKMYPSIPDLPEEVFVSIAKNIEGPYCSLSESADRRSVSRRVSMMQAERQTMASPASDDVTAHQSKADRYRRITFKKELFLNQ